MSYIIDKSGNPYFYKRPNPKTPNPKNYPNPQPLQPTSPKPLSLQLPQTLLQNHILHHIKPLSPTVSKILLSPLIFLDSWLLLLKLTINESEFIYIQLQVLKLDGSYFCIGHYQHRLLINKMILKGYNSLMWKLFKINVNLDTGAFRFTLPLQLVWNAGVLGGRTVLSREIGLNKLLHFLMKEGMQSFRYLLGILYRQENKHLELSGQLNNQHKIQQLHRYNQMVFINNQQLQNSDTFQQSTIRNNKLKEEQSIKKICQNRVEMGDMFSKAIGLFAQAKFSWRELKDQMQFMLSIKEVEMISGMIALPSQSRQRMASNNRQSLYVQNYIQIKQVDKIKLTPLSSGGFSSLFISQFTFQRDNKAKDLVKKVLVLKRQSNDNSRNRNQHQKSIINKMKTSSSLLLNRYYFPNPSTSQFQNDILMDYIPFPNLKDYIVCNNRIMSLQARIYMIFMIVQAARTIKGYNIVHLDIKPDNVLIFCNMFVKLIDFGESYHPDVDKKGYQPGFTLPYSCPEIHRRAQHFSSKSDVYSLGILLHELLFQKYPFFMQKPSLIQTYKSQKYLQLWFCCPQEMIAYGDQLIYPVLNRLIGSCLQSDAEMRPDLNSMALLLNHIIIMLN